MFIDGFFTGALFTMLVFMASVAVYNNNHKEEKRHAAQAHDRPRGVPSVVCRSYNPWDLSV